MPLTGSADAWLPTSAAVIGGGTMGCGIVQVLAHAGARVTLIGGSDERAAHAMDRLRRRTHSQVEAGLRPADDAGLLDNVAVSGNLSRGIAGAELVIESVPEDFELKREILVECSHLLGQDAVLATNTSSFPIGSLAASLPRPQRFLGLHWFNPPEWVPGVEVIPSAETEESTLAASHALLAAIGKRGVQVGDSPGFVANRLQYALFREALACVEEGVASHQAVDAAVRFCFGFRLPFYGPFEIADMAGLDIYMSVFATLRERLGENFRAPDSLTELVADGRTGLKSGAGFYDWPTEQVDDLLEQRDRRYALLSRVVDAAPGEHQGG